MVRLRNGFRRGFSGLAQLVVAAGLGAGAVTLIMGGGGNGGSGGSQVTYGVAEPANATQSCDIKGNVSIETGERIYHVPGQKYYARTKIDSQYGERWFCSEAEARAAGWRKSRV